jgi:HTH-type transcriptional regulator / antitoxin HigA
MTTKTATASAENDTAWHRVFPLRPIRNDDEHRRAIDTIDRLSDQEERTPEEHDYLIVLGMLIEQYENSIYEHPDFTGPEMLRFLIDENGLSLTKLSEETGIPITSLSDILHGRRGISPKVRMKLCKRFGVNPSLLL